MGGENERGATEPAPNIPEPPREVKIRTMQSDMESVVSSGGNPLPKSVQVELPRRFLEEAQSVPEAGAPAGSLQPRKKRIIPLPLIALLVIGVAVAAGFFIYNLFYSGSASNLFGLIPQVPATPPPITALPSAGGQAAVGGGQAPPIPAFKHQSFFRKPADGAVALAIHSTAQSAFDLQTYSQKLLSILPAAGAGLFEVNAVDESGNALGAIQLFSYADISSPDPAYLFAHFNPDVTMFVYMDKSGSSPGYILQLQPSENWLFLKNDVAKMEQSPSIAGFFLNSPGLASAGGFKDAIIGGQPARELSFSAPGAAFVYGWYSGYLIMSASESGYKEALSRL